MPRGPSGRDLEKTAPARMDDRESARGRPESTVGTAPYCQSRELVAYTSASERGFRSKRLDSSAPSQAVADTVYVGDIDPSIVRATKDT